jgi:hypothetical protein
MLESYGSIEMMRQKCVGCSGFLLQLESPISPTRVVRNDCQQSRKMRKCGDDPKSLFLGGNHN